MIKIYDSTYIKRLFTINEYFIDYTPINTNTLNIIKQFQKANSIIIGIQKENKYENISLLKPFLKFSSIKTIYDRVQNEINIINDFKINKLNIFTSIESFYNKETKIVLHLFSDIGSGTVKKYINSSLIANYIKKISSNLDNVPKKEFIQMKDSLANIFSAGKQKGYFGIFNYDVWNSIIKRDTNDYQLSHLPPIKYTDTFEYILYYISELKNTINIDNNLTGQKFIDYINTIYKKNSIYKKLVSISSSYLSSNRKELIPSIISYINQLPIIKAENDRLKKITKIVYRGIGTDDEDVFKTILNKKTENRDYVATTTQEHTAKNFSYGISHLEPTSSKRFKYNLLLTYKVDDKGIIIDLACLGGVFGESEIIISTKKSKLIKIKEL